MRSFSSMSIYRIGLRREHIVAFAAIFSNFCTAHVQKRLYINFRCKFRQRRSIRRPRFPIKRKKIQRFGDVFRWFLHFICWMFAIFLLPVCLTYWPTMYTTRVDPHVDNSHQAWKWSHVTLWPWLWPFDLEQVSFMAGHVTNLANKCEDLTPISFWVMSYNVSPWLLLKMRTRPLRMRRITWLVSRGQKQLHFWNARPRFAYSLCNFGGSTIKVIKVICENNARLCIKRRMSFCAYAKSRDLLKVP